MRDSQCPINCLATHGSHHDKIRFMTAASPGIVALTLANRYYVGHEDYVSALAEELRKEYEIIVANGLTLQLDCPDLAMERHISYQHEPLSAFQDKVALPIQAKWILLRCTELGWYWNPAPELNSL